MTASKPRLLRTREEIRAAGAAAVEGWPPLTDAGIEQLAIILAPIGDMWRTKAAQRQAETLERSA